MREQDREGVAKLLPVITEFEKTFWDGLQARKLMVQECPECGHVQFPPSPVCTSCLSPKVAWKECSGKATLWSKVIFHKQYLAPYGDVPYGVVIAALQEGPLVTGRMPLEELQEASFDAPLTLDCVTTADGTVLANFVLS